MDHKAYKIFDGEDFERLTRGIKVAQCMRTDSSADTNLDAETALSKLEDLSVSDKLFCSYCACSFENQTQQRLHYKLDWHRYNLKQSLFDKKAVTEENFSQLADHDDVSSISGSESEDDEEDDEDGDATSKTSDGKKTDRLLASRHTKVFFENGDGKIISLHRCLLHGKKAVLEKDEEFVSMAMKCGDRTKWAIFMLGGGHFAAAIFDGREVLEHKTFHSYTVRKGQGGTQSSRDNRSGGSHPKSAGASLRRFNEAALTQHVQDITSSWSNHLSECHLVFYRASGGNTAVLFGGRNPPFDKRDPRLRTLPFPTRRATFSEVKRVQDVLATVEMYGMAESYQSSFPQSPRKKLLPKPVTEPSDSPPLEPTVPLSVEQPVRARRRPDRAKSREAVERNLPAVVARLARDSSEEDDDSDDDCVMTYENVTMDFARDLSEYGDSVQRTAKNKRRKKPKKAKAKSDEERPELIRLSKRLGNASKKDDISALKTIVDSILNQVSSQVPVVDVSFKNLESPSLINEGCSEDVVKELDKKEGNEEGKERPTLLSQEDLVTCLNRPVDNQDNTLLHFATSSGRMDVVRYLMEVGSNPSARNKKGLPPYVAATTKEMRNVFRRFLGEFPDKYDYAKSLIPGGLTDAMEEEQAERRRALKKVKREREKVKKKVEEEKKVEQDEKERFLKLTDREKRALAAERRVVSGATTRGGAAPVLARCFLCAVDMSGKVPFEYDIHRFCSITCLKAHRMSHKTTL